MSSIPATVDAAGERVDWKGSIPFIILQLMPIGIIWTGARFRDVVLCLALYYARMFFVSAGFHRYFSHRSYKLGRGMQFLMCLGGTLAVQDGMMRWVTNHRLHHKHSDTPLDPHSSRRGFWWSHIGWILCGKHTKRAKRIVEEFRRFPEIIWLERYAHVPPVVLGALVLLVFGWSGLFAGFFLSTTLLYHGTFSVNSLNHKWGRRRYATGEDSTNSWLIALWTCGEGWHNNHHHYQSSTSQGFFWWEYDVSYYVLRALQAVGLAEGVKRPPRHILSHKLLK